VFSRGSHTTVQPGGRPARLSIQPPALPPQQQELSCRRSGSSTRVGSREGRAGYVCGLRRGAGVVKGELGACYCHSCDAGLDLRDSQVGLWQILCPHRSCSPRPALSWRAPSKAHRTACRSSSTTTTAAPRHPSHRRQPTPAVSTREQCTPAAAAYSVLPAASQLLQLPPAPLHARSSCQHAAGWRHAQACSAHVGQQWQPGFSTAAAQGEAPALRPPHWGPCP
jgi:hypothetical protein